MKGLTKIAKSYPFDTYANAGNIVSTAARRVRYEHPRASKDDARSCCQKHRCNYRVNQR